MGKKNLVTRQTKVLEERRKEANIKNAIKAFEDGRFKSIRKAAEAYHVPYSTLSRRLKETTSPYESHIDQMLLCPQEEKTIVRWIFRLDEWGFPIRLRHLKEAIELLKFGANATQSSDDIGGHLISRFLRQHPEVLAKLNASIEADRIKASDPKLIQLHFTRIQKARAQYGITDANIYNMDEKGFREGTADRAKAPCKRLPKGNRDSITVVEAISGDGFVVPPLIIFRGAAHYVWWYEHLDSVQSTDWTFAYTAAGWEKRVISIEWITHFDTVTKPRLSGSEQYRLLILDGYEIHISIEVVEYCIGARIVPYCLPAHSARLLQPLDVGLYSSLRKHYGEQVDDLMVSGEIEVTKGSFLPMLENARIQAFTKANILSAWRGAGLIPPNPRVILAQPSPHRESDAPAPAPPPPIPPTPSNSAPPLHHARQATLESRNPQNGQLAELVDSLERFAINKDTELQLEKDIDQQRQQAQALKAPTERRELRTRIGGRVLGAAAVGDMMGAGESGAGKARKSGGVHKEAEG